jgi:hypothetical protein
LSSKAIEKLGEIEKKPDVLDSATSTRETKPAPASAGPSLLDPATPLLGQEPVTKLHQLYSLWGEYSGDHELNRLKNAVTDCSTRFDDAVRLVSAKRLEVENAQRLHDETQKRYSQLMMKRDQWDAADAALFVEVTSQEVNGRQLLQNARESLRKAEDDSGLYQRDYMDAMRRRYHEEQMWQDKWRVAGTFGTWSLIGLNSIIFMGGQYFHIKREKGRLQAIEDLINSKMPSVAVDAGSVTHYENNVDEVVEKAEAVELASTVSESASPTLGDSDQTSTTELSKEIQSSSTPLALVHQIQTCFLSAKIACEKAVNGLDWSSARKATEEIHWPSALAGAAVASTGFFAFAIFSRR